MHIHLQVANLSAYERRLEELGSTIDREIHKILLHLARELPLSPASEEMPVTKNVMLKVSTVPDRVSSLRRANALGLLELYLYRLRLKAQATGVETPSDMLTYAQLLNQALRDMQMLH